MPGHPREEMVSGLVLQTSEVEPEEGVDKDLKREEKEWKKSDFEKEKGRVSRDRGEGERTRLTSIL